MAASIQSSFAAGEISPELHGRIDQALYYIALAQAKNMVVQQPGGIYNRGGLRYVGNIKNHEEGVRLIQFKFSAEDTYVLELGHKYIRFIRNDVHVTEGGKTITSINRGSNTIVSSNGHGYATGDDVYISGVVGMKEINERWFRVVRTSANQFRLQSQVDDTNIDSSGYSGYTSGGKSYKIYEISTPYEFDDLLELKYSQSADIITFVHLDYPIHQLKRYNHTNWEFEEETFFIDRVFPVGIGWASYGSPSGGVTGTIMGSLKVAFVVTAVDELGIESIPGLLGVGYNITNINVVSNNLVVTYNDTRVALPDNVRAPTYVAGGNVSNLNASPVTGTFASSTTHTGGEWDGLEDGDDIEIYGLEGGLNKLNGRRFLITNHNVSNNTFVLHDEDIAEYVDIPYTTGGTIYPTVGRYNFSSLSYYQNPQLVPQLGVSLYNVYVKLPGENKFGFGYSLKPEDIDTSGNYSGTLYKGRPFTRVNTSLFSIASTSRPVPNAFINPPEYTDLFSRASDYPSVVGFFQQRGIFGSTKSKPESLFYSATGNYKLFQTSRSILGFITKDDDPIVTTLSSGEVNNIRHLVGLNDFLVLTDSTQWQVRPAVGAGLSAKTIEQRPQARVGASHVVPVVFDDVVIYIREGGRSVIGLGYNVDREGYVPADLSLLSSHMFEATPVVAMAGVYVPRKQLFCVLADGNVACLTFIPDQKVIAWTRWYTDGQFESVAVARPSIGSVSDDEAYFVVRRVINGQVVRYIERTDNRQFEDVEDCYFVDAGLTYDNPIEITDIDRGGTTTVTAEDHGLAVGYEINFSDIKWEKKYDEFFTEVPLDQLNKQKYKVKSVLSTSKFTLGDFDDNSDIDSTEFTRYISAGKVRSMVQTLRGLWYLEGKKVAVLADGNVIDNLVVQGGKVVLPYRYGRIHIGLRYISEIETLPISVQEPSLQGAPKSLTEVLVRVYRSRGLLLASVGGDFYTLPMRTDEAWGEPTKLLTGEASIPMTNQWGVDGAFIVRQKDPLPMGILSVLPVFTLGDAK